MRVVADTRSGVESDDTNALDRASREKVEKFVGGDGAGSAADAFGGLRHNIMVVRDHLPIQEVLCDLVNGMGGGT